MCEAGWTGAQCSTDIDECHNSSSNQCVENSHCVNREPSYICQCDPGYTKLSNSQSTQCTGTLTSLSNSGLSINMINNNRLIQAFTVILSTLVSRFMTISHLILYVKRKCDTCFMLINNIPKHYSQNCVKRTWTYKDILLRCGIFFPSVTFCIKPSYKMKGYRISVCKNNNKYRSQDFSCEQVY